MNIKELSYKELKEAHNLYIKLYRDKNKEKIRRYNREYQRKRRSNKVVKVIDKNVKNLDTNKPKSVKNLDKSVKVIDKINKENVKVIDTLKQTNTNFNNIFE